MTFTVSCFSFMVGSKHPPILTVVTVQEGTSITLNCTTTIGATVTWSKDHESFPANTEVNPMNTILRVKTVTLQNTGRYTCTAYNTDGNIVAYDDFTLNVQPTKGMYTACLLYTSPSPRDATLSRMPSSA